MTSQVRAASLEYLQSDKTVITLRHYHGWAQGDIFAFIDINSPFDKVEPYFEVNPRLRVFRSLYGAYMIESAPGYQAHLFGAAYDVLFAQIHIYRRSDGFYQITLVWLQQIGRIVLQGFHDYGTLGTVSQPQIRYVINDSISAGVEGQYFTIGRTDHRLQALIRITF